MLISHYNGIVVVILGLLHCYVCFASYSSDTGCVLLWCVNVTDLFLFSNENIVIE